MHYCDRELNVKMLLLRMPHAWAEKALVAAGVTTRLTKSQHLRMVQALLGMRDHMTRKYPFTYTKLLSKYQQLLDEVEKIEVAEGTALTPLMDTERYREVTWFLTREEKDRIEGCARNRDYAALSAWIQTIARRPEADALRTAFAFSEHYRSN